MLYFINRKIIYLMMYNNKYTRREKPKIRNYKKLFKKIVFFVDRFNWALFKRFYSFERLR